MDGCAALRCMDGLPGKIKELRSKDSARLQQEYKDLVNGLRKTRDGLDDTSQMANPVLPQDVLDEVC